MTQIPARQRGRKKRLPSDTRLFRFTEEDEARMICAMASAVQYMKSYGKGADLSASLQTCADTFNSKKT